MGGSWILSGVCIGKHNTALNIKDTIANPFQTTQGSTKVAYLANCSLENICLTFFLCKGGNLQRRYDNVAFTVDG